MEYNALSKGSRGEDVKAVQYLPRHHGHSVSVDGVFGSGTHDAVRAFQSANGLTVDGVVGSATWGKLIVTTSQGASGDRVGAITTLLNKYDLGGVTSSFTSTVKQRVIDFQHHLGLSADGIVGATTWKHLVWHYEQPRPFSGSGAVICKG